MRRYGVWQPIWSIALFVWLLSIIIGFYNSDSFGVVFVLCAANAAMLVADVFGLADIQVKTGIITLINLYFIIKPIKYPESLPVVVSSILFLLYCLFVFMSVCAVIAVYRGDWVEKEKERVAGDFYEGD